ncbi:MAG: hypothetical protein JWO43_37 [Candidatus Adlerbacteria bacterium]|nr:hypothetical protein [Candidatus Adlerbacteria bacterium]
MNLTNLELYAHLSALTLAAISIVAADNLGMRWFFGKTRVINRAQARILHYSTGTALVLLLISGATMFWPLRDYLLHDPLFILKMCFVAALIVNSIVIEKLMGIAATTPFAELPQTQKVQFILSGAMSGLCWAGAALCGYFLF